MNKHKEIFNRIPTFPSSQAMQDQRLLLLLKHISRKIAQTKDQSLIKLYLQQSHQIALQRYALQKGGGA